MEQELSDMPFLPPSTGNFACFALKTRTSLPLRGTITINPGVYASSEAPFTIGSFWRDSLGTIETQHINDSNLFISVVSEDPSISITELSSDLHTYYYSLLIQGVGYSSRGISLFGPNAVDRMNVNTLGRLPNYYEPPKVIASDVDRERLLNTPKLAAGINFIYANQQGDEYLRLRKGFNAFLEGIQRHLRYDRLHHFVRAIEATIRPRQGAGTKNFTYRCQFFAGRTSPVQEMLGELYELRSAAEHLNPLQDKLLGYPLHERENLVALRTYQSELLASFLYNKILTNKPLLAAFQSDQSISDLWSMEARDLINVWGKPVDLNVATTGRFYDYLK